MNTNTHKTAGRARLGKQFGRISIKALFAVILMPLATAPGNLRAATLTVTSTADGGAGTLRAALANVADGDTINLSVTGIIYLTSGELRVTNSIFILGPRADALVIDGNYASRVFFIGPNTIVTIAGLTIANGTASGSAPPYGGGIFNNSATLTISNCAITGNSGPGAGGGIFNRGEVGGSASLTVVNTTLRGNSSIYYGGAIHNGGYFGNASLQVVNSTFNGNSAPYGGAIYNDGYSGRADLQVINSTLHGNSAYQGGGIKNAGALGNATVEILSSTLSNNEAVQNGGNIYNDGGSGNASLQIGNSILMSGASGANIRNSGSVTITSLGYNLSSDDAAGFLSAAGDQINTDPKLGALQNNGGPTWTQALLAGSPAIDAGDDSQASSISGDQRGYLRNAGAQVDIGAFESQPMSLPLRVDTISRTVSGGVRLDFTNTPGAIITVVAATNATLPPSSWTDLGVAAQIAPGQFQFIDSQANLPQRMYRLFAP